VVVVEAGAGAASGFADDAYRGAGAAVDDDAAMIWRCPLIVKVKEVQRGEYARLSPGTTVFGFAQLNRDRALLAAVLAARVRVIAFETVRDVHGALPLLAPMSRASPGASHRSWARRRSWTSAGGNGTLVTGVDAVPGARVVVIGAGNVGGEAARVAARMGCDVTVFSRGAARLAMLAAGNERIHTVTLAGDPADLHDAITRADLVICGVLEPGRLSPKLIPRDVVRAMRGGSAIVDVGIDQGGVAETSRMTSLSQPTYVEEGVVHYAVPNMPALVARTASLALAAAALPYVRRLADGVAHALEHDAALAAGVMAWDGAIAHAGLAADLGSRASAAPWRADRAERAA
jgi:alanine dehydrogenase